MTTIAPTQRPRKAPPYLPSERDRALVETANRVLYYTDPVAGMRRLRWQHVTRGTALLGVRRGRIAAAPAHTTLVAAAAALERDGFVIERQFESPTVAAILQRAPQLIAVWLRAEHQPEAVAARIAAMAAY